MKRKIIAHFSLAIVVLISFFSSLKADVDVNKHIIVLYDFSGSVLNQSVELKRANQYLLKCICEDSITEKDLTCANDFIVNKIKKYNFSEPLFQSGDICSFCSFGINSDGIATVTASVTTHAAFFENFSKELIKIHDSYPNPNDNSIKEFLKRNYPNAKTKKFNYTFSRYALPFACKVIPEFYPAHTIFAIVSDFKHGTDDANLADQLLIQRFFPTFLNATKHFEENFATTFKVLDLLTLNVGAINGIVIKVVEIQSALPATILLKSEEKPVLLKKGVDEYKLSKTKFRLQNLENFRVSERYILLNFPKAKQIKQYETQFVRGSLNQGEITVAELSIPRIEIPRSENIAKLKLKLVGKFNWENSPLSASIESNEISIPIQHSPSSKAGRIVLIVIAGLITIGLGTWGLAFRDPKVFFQIAKNYERLDDKDNTIVLDWSCREFRIPISLKNISDILNFNYPSPVVVVDTPIVPEEYQSLIDISLISENGDDLRKRDFGEEIILGRLAPKNEKSVYLVIDLAKFPEPENKTNPIKFKVSYKVNIKNDYVPQLEYEIVIRRSLGQFWLGIDPGTSSSCIAGGDQLNNIELVKFYDSFVIPSLVTIRSDYVPQNDLKKINHYSDGIACGKEAELLMRANLDRTFYSAKKLIGYNVSRKIKLNDIDFSISGQDVVKILSDYMIKQSREYFTSQRAGVQINKAAVAVPNNFTPLKIAKMVEAVKNAVGIEKVHHVYEAEAVALYYLSNYETFNKNRFETIPPGVRENILIFDFGGGTINISVIGLTRPIFREDKVKLDILARVGYAIGGETIDRIIAGIIWNKIGEIKNYFTPDPFASLDEVLKLEENIRNEWWRLSLNLKDLAEKTKVRISDRFRLSNDHFQKKYSEDISDKIIYDTKDVISYNYLNSQLQDIIDKMETKNIIIETDEIMNNDEILKVIKRLKEGIESVLNIYYETNLEPIHSVIFSGRSSFFPAVREKIKEKIEEKNKGQKPYYIEEMTEDEVKFAVAYGATYYAAEQENILLSKTKTLANYGYLIVNPIKRQADTFKNIIPIGTSFDENSDEAIGTDKNQEVKHNNKLVRFYQVNCEKSKAEDTINNKEKEKYNQVAEVRISSDFIESLTLRINLNDKFIGEIKDRKGSAPITANVEINDIKEDTDEKYSWLLG